MCKCIVLSRFGIMCQKFKNLRIILIYWIEHIKNRWHIESFSKYMLTFIYICCLFPFAMLKTFWKWLNILYLNILNIKMHKKSKWNYQYTHKHRYINTMQNEMVSTQVQYATITMNMVKYKFRDTILQSSQVISLYPCSSKICSFIANFANTLSNWIFVFI